MRKKPTTPVIATVTTAALFLSACAQGTDSADLDEADFENPTAGGAPEGALEGMTLTYVSWGGGQQDGEMEAYAEPFADITGAEVLGDGPTDEAQLRAQIDADNVDWDVINASPMRTAGFCDELYEPLDFDLIDTSELLEGVSVGECHVASLAYGYTFFYNEDIYGDNPPQSWEDFFDVDQFPGTRGIDGRTSPGPGLMESALMADGVDPDDLYPIDIERGVEKWASIEEHLVYWTSGAEQTQLMQGGEADIVVGWTGPAYEAYASGANFVPNWNQAFPLADSLGIAKGSDNILAAHAFINHALGAEQQAHRAELTAYSPINVNADPELDEDLRLFDVAQPENIEQTTQMDEEYWGDRIEELAQAWTDFLQN